MSSGIRNFFQRLIKERFRITFFHDDFKPVFSLRFTLFSLILWIIGFATLIIIITTIIIAKTSLKEYIPGYGSTEEKIQILRLVSKIDSLEDAIQKKNVYLQSVLKVFKDEKDSIIPKPRQINNTSNPSHLKAEQQELSVRKEIENEWLSEKKISDNIEVEEVIQFLPPVQGVVISQFNPAKGHYGIDIVSKKDESVRSIAKGIVVYSGYSINDGNFIVISHSAGLMSIYKHLSVLLKSTGDVVNANEMIGNVGNTGTESTGYHLHFELWYKENPVNPMNYILW